MDTSRYERLLELKEGARVHVRPIRPEDEPLLREAFARMSERSVYFRFFSPLKRLPDSMARHFARVDYDQRFALVAVTHRPSRGVPAARVPRDDGLEGGVPPQNRREHVLGVARYDRAPGTDTAEVAVAVVDDSQRQGIGSGLLRLLADVGREHGIRAFSLVVLPENQSMLGLLRRLGWLHEVRLDGGIYEITFKT